MYVRMTILVSVWIKFMKRLRHISSLETSVAKSHSVGRSEGTERHTHALGKCGHSETCAHINTYDEEIGTR